MFANAAAALSVFNAAALFASCFVSTWYCSPQAQVFASGQSPHGVRLQRRGDRGNMTCGYHAAEIVAHSAFVSATAAGSLLPPLPLLTISVSW